MTSESKQELLVLKGISKAYAGVKALDSVDFAIDRGEIRCLVGENGSGKSTLIKIISGFVRPDEGQIFVEGRTLGKESSLDSIKSGIEVIYQEMSLFPNLTVAENIAVNQRIEAGERLIRGRRHGRSPGRGSIQSAWTSTLAQSSGDFQLRPSS